MKSRSPVGQRFGWSLVEAGQRVQSRTSYLHTKRNYPLTLSALHGRSRFRTRPWTFCGVISGCQATSDAVWLARNVVSPTTFGREAVYEVGFSWAFPLWGPE